ncbi:hypothetical protein [uncultured Salinisphaera sp.]|uniref:hypothetical protein n=1 Tax=uncultured Salinisphaera sp. TaxID=359372 RepID=UPI0032B1CB5B|tara:strand:- start:7358 stop:7561 length:204 start_codon:yes stop_codon:yes gene_type:complete
MSYEVTYRIPDSSDGTSVQLTTLINDDGDDVTTRFDAWTKSKGLSTETPEEIQRAVSQFKSEEKKQA